MKNYLNSQQKKNLTVMFACAQFLQEIIEAGERYIPSSVQADLKRGRTFTQKAMDAWLAELDQKTARYVVNTIKDHEICVMPTLSARTSELFREYQGMLSGKEYMHRMAEITLDAKCKSCDGSCRDTCALLECYTHFEVPVFDETHPNCPYAMIR
ncbi:MAG: DUF5651 domain-containing protein [Firmicutes bacterium]|nr:DUF5651 domain-containing protein [Bacillota bacterium]